MAGYEKEYHQHLHGHLATDNEYYKARADLATKKYFHDVSKDARVLEFGCGMGHNIFRLHNAVGYDISKYSLDFCRDKGIKVIEDLSEIADGSCDVVFSAHVLEHVDNPSEVIQQMRSKLKPQGKLILILPVDKHGNVSDFKFEASQHIFAWTFRTINNLLVKNGFKIDYNKYLRGEGYKKFLPVNKVSPGLYSLLTQTVSYIHNTKEMKIVATKI